MLRRDGPELPLFEIYSVLVDPGGFMTKGKSKGSTAVDRAAEAVGHALGTVAGTIDSLQEQHPHPVEEARDALVAGQEAVAAVASKAGTGAAAVIEQAKAVARRTKKAVTPAGKAGRQSPGSRARRGKQ